MRLLAPIIAFGVLSVLAFQGIFALPDPVEDFAMLGAMLSVAAGYAVVALRNPSAIAPARD